MATNGKDYNDVERLGSDETHESALRKIQTAGSISISPELFEKLYLSPENRVKGDLRKTFGNLTPIGLCGFLLSLTPLSCFLMNFRGSRTGDGSSDIPAYLFFGGVLMVVAGVLEWILGNTYISVVFTSFGAFWLTYGGVLQPFYSAYGNYSPDPSVPSDGLTQATFNDSFAFFLLFMGLLCVIYTVCSLRTNVVLFLVLLPLPGAFTCLAAAFWYIGEGLTDRADTLLTAGGALAFVTCMAGWYLFTALMLASVDAPFSLPVFDLSTKIKGASDLAAKKREDV